jgi:hypothetical protein
MRKINLLNMCRHPLNSKFNNFTSILLPQNNHASQTFAIIKKISHEVRGMGYECTVERNKITTALNFFLNISQIYKIEPIPVSMNVCWKMVRSNKCMGKEMTCDIVNLLTLNMAEMFHLQSPVQDYMSRTLHMFPTFVKLKNH